MKGSPYGAIDLGNTTGGLFVTKEQLEEEVKRMEGQDEHSASSEEDTDKQEECPSPDPFGK